MDRRVERGGSRERPGRDISNLEISCGNNTLKLFGTMCTEVGPADKNLYCSLFEVSLAQSPPA